MIERVWDGVPAGPRRSLRQLLYGREHRHWVRSLQLAGLHSWLGSELPEVTHFCLPKAGVTHVNQHIWLYVIAKDLPSVVTWAYVANTSLTDSFHQPRVPSPSFLFLSPFLSPCGPGWFQTCCLAEDEPGLPASLSECWHGGRAQPHLVSVMLGTGAQALHVLTSTY